jgi:hypothetical protein
LCIRVLLALKRVRSFQLHLKSKSKEPNQAVNPYHFLEILSCQTIPSVFRISEVHSAPKVTNKNC